MNTATSASIMTSTIGHMPKAIIINGAPWFRLREILKATDHRPFFIRQGLLSLEGLKKFLQRSDKPEAPKLLAQIGQHFPT